MSDLIFGDWVYITNLCMLRAEDTGLPLTGNCKVNKAGRQVFIEGKIEYSDEMVEAADLDDQLRLYIPDHVAPPNWEIENSGGVCRLYAGTSSSVKGHYSGTFAVKKDSDGDCFLVFFVHSYVQGPDHSITLDRPVQWEEGDYLWFQGWWRAR